MLKKHKSQITTAFTGILFALLLLEFSLYCAGIIESARRGQRNVAQPNQPRFTILCYGNSFTAGDGAPPGESYCDFLDKMINASPEYNFQGIRAINRGRPSFNSTQVYNAIRDELVQFHPNLVLIMTGQPNGWNYAGYSNALSRLTSKNFLMGPSLAGLYDLLFHVRIFRFAFHVYIDVLNHISGSKFDGPGDYFAKSPALANWVESDVVAITRLLDGRGIKYIFQTYPPKLNGERHAVDYLLLDLAKKRQLPLCDTFSFLTRFFTGKANKDPYYSRIFSLDDHLSGLGYRAVAESLFLKIQRDQILPTAKPQQL